SIIKLNVVNPIPSKAISVLLGYKNIYFFEEHVKNGSVAAKLALRLMDEKYEGSYHYTCIENFAVNHATVPELQKKCHLDAESITKKIKGEE
ncbi:MAG: hypothetical protein RSA20_06970, partial [Oscillospiraceae bacterium]